MTPKEIARIIKACKNAGISEFKLDNLYFKFSEPTAPQATFALSQGEALVELERKLTQDEDLQQLLLQNTMMEDPLLYEEMRSPHAAKY